MSRYRLIACDVLRAEAEALMDHAPQEFVATAWMEQGLHDEPEKLTAALQAEIDGTGDDIKAVLLLYGLCSNGVLGLTARQAPLVIPRVHDCISLYLGSAARYAAEHEQAPGTYWFSRGFIHRDGGNSGGLMGHAVGEESFTPQRREELYAQYCEEYGEENADYLLETWVDAWKRNYTRAVFLRWDYPEADADRQRVHAYAAENGWAFEEMLVDLRLLEQLLAGDWPADEFLCVPPGQTITATHDCHVLGCRGCG